MKSQNFEHFEFEYSVEIFPCLTDAERTRSKMSKMRWHDLIRIKGFSDTRYSNPKEARRDAVTLAKMLSKSEARVFVVTHGRDGKTYIREITETDYIGRYERR